MSQNYENMEDDFIPQLEEVDTAYNDILDHNRTHTGMGAAMANMMKTVMRNSEVISDDDDENGETTEVLDMQNPAEAIDKAHKDAVIEGDMDAELQDMFHGDTFTRVGISLEPSGTYMSKFTGEDVTSRALVPTIANGELFNSFLAKQNPEDVSPIDTPLIPDAIAGLRTTIATSFNAKNRAALTPDELSMVTEHGEDALRTFITLAPQLERLGMDADSLRQAHAIKPEGRGWLYLGDGASEEKHAEKAAHDEYRAAHKMADTYENLDKYVTYWGRDLLPEYLEGSSYLGDPDDDSFGPSKWHIDGGQPYWKKAIDFVAKMDSEDRTKAFGQEVRDSLIISVDAAMAPAKEGEPDYADRQREDLQNIRNVLTGEDYDADMLEAYTTKRY